MPPVPVVAATPVPTRLNQVSTVNVPRPSAAGLPKVTCVCRAASELSKRRALACAAPEAIVSATTSAAAMRRDNMVGCMGSDRVRSSAPRCTEFTRACGSVSR